MSMSRNGVGTCWFTTRIISSGVTPLAASAGHERAGARAHVDVELVDRAVHGQQVERAQGADLVDAAREAAAAEHQGGARLARRRRAAAARLALRRLLELDDLAHPDLQSIIAAIRPATATHGRVALFRRRGCADSPASPCWPRALLPCRHRPGAGARRARARPSAAAMRAAPGTSGAYVMDATSSTVLFQSAPPHRGSWRPTRSCSRSARCSRSLVPTPPSAPTSLGARQRRLEYRHLARRHLPARRRRPHLRHRVIRPALLRAGRHRRGARRSSSTSAGISADQGADHRRRVALRQPARRSGLGLRHRGPGSAAERAVVRPRPGQLERRLVQHNPPLFAAAAARQGAEAPGRRASRTSATTGGTPVGREDAGQRRSRRRSPSSPGITLKKLATTGSPRCC